VGAGPVGFIDALDFQQNSHTNLSVNKIFTGFSVCARVAGERGPLPPMKIHCAQLVEGALRSAPDAKAYETRPAVPAQPVANSNLLDNFTKPKEGGVRLVFLDNKEDGKKWGITTEAQRHGGDD
jgi:hypothetical protein